MVDSILNFEKYKYIETKKLTSISEEIYESHFPYFPILPAVLLLENIKQSIELLEQSSELNWKIKKCKKVKLYKPVHPGDVIVTSVTKENKSEKEYYYNAVITNQDNELVCRANKIECNYAE
ncbi:hypothetical protein [Paraliobacillus sp. JSM ZJ581]|uniref:hypothetical protein n=1 Tax=Paraliobacillus sp. JSM ZJ581 TaxID=3342118 RepID=UPI0035A95A20